jgi:hypothetical protein
MDQDGQAAEAKALARRHDDVGTESKACNADPLNTDKHDLHMADLLQQTEELTQVIAAVRRLRR